MQPEEFFFISADQTPRLPSGKINAKALQQTPEENFAATQRKAVRVLDLFILLVLLWMILIWVFSFEQWRM